MSVDDCFLPFHSPLREPTAYDRWGKGPQPCWSQLDLDKCALGLGGSGVLQFLNRPVASRRPGSRSRPSIRRRIHRPSHFSVSSAASRGRYARCEKDLHALPTEPGQSHPPYSQPASNGRYARSPEIRNALREIYIRRGMQGKKYIYKPPEIRNALREKRVAFRQKAARHHAEVALRKYNGANNTKFELVEVAVIRQFWEFGGGCIHYNFTAKPAEDHHHHSADADSTKLFFSEVNSAFHGESDVVLCCIVGEKDNGHCYGCKGYEPTVVHPSSQAYGGGSST